MAFDDPARLDLAALFRDEAMFDSRRSWSAAGFHVNDRSNNGKIMVARHPSVQGLLFKKYTSDLDEHAQTRNFKRRLDGAKRLRAFVATHQLGHLVVPHKWILELPRRFAHADVLVVEQLDLVSDEQTHVAYHRIEPHVLGELCVLLFHFRGMDSNTKNLPFIADGRIGLIDTEHWDRSTRKAYLHHLDQYLTHDRKAFAKRIFDQLEDGAAVEVSGFSRAFDESEDTSTSSASSDSSISSASSSS